jgi:VWFA-related protein
MRWMKCWARIARQGRLRRAGVQLFLFALLGSALSQENSPQQNPSRENLPQETIRSQSNVVMIPALVKSAKGEIVYGLAAKDFVVEDDGVEQAARLDEVAQGQPVSLVIAIQRGRRANYEFPRIRGLGAMLDPLLAQGLATVAIVEFDSQVELIQDSTKNSERIAGYLRELQPGDDGAAILDAVDYSVKLLDRVPKERQRVLLLISETRDHGSQQATIDEVVAEIGRSSTAVYALAFSPSRSNVLDTFRGNNVNEMNAEPDFMAPLIMAAQAMRKNAPREIASMSGGEYELFATQKHFDARMVDFTNHLHSRYLLRIEPKSPHAGLHRLRVRLRDAGDRTVLARSSYWAAGAGK